MLSVCSRYDVGMLLVCCGYVACVCCRYVVGILWARRGCVVGMLWPCCWYVVRMLRVCNAYFVGMLWVCCGLLNIPTRYAQHPHNIPTT